MLRQLIAASAQQQLAVRPDQGTLKIKIPTQCLPLHSPPPPHFPPLVRTVPRRASRSVKRFRTGAEDGEDVADNAQKVEDEGGAVGRVGEHDSLGRDRCDGDQHRRHVDPRRLASHLKER